MKKFYLLGLAAAALFAGVYIQGCGSSSGGDGGGGVGCTSDSECGSTGLCNTAIGQCMTKCTQGSDCSPTTTCAVDHTSGTVCTCSIDSQCPSGSVCNVADQACQLKCTSDTNCQGYAQTRKCDTATGQCVPNGGGNDAGNNNPTCDATHPCTTTTDPATNPYCSTAGTCTTDPNGGGGQCTTVESQDVCAYGAACFTDTATSPLPICEFVGSCSGAFATTPTANASPVVYDVTATGSATSTPNPGDGTCNTDMMQQFTGHYYDPQGDVPTGSTSATYNNIFYVTSSASGATYYHTTIDSSSGTFTFYMCTDTSNSLKGVYLTDSAGNQSNTTCVSF